MKRSSAECSKMLQFNWIAEKDNISNLWSLQKLIKLSEEKIKHPWSKLMLLYLYQSYGKHDINAFSYCFYVWKLYFNQIRKKTFLKVTNIDKSKSKWWQDTFKEKCSVQTHRILRSSELCRLVEELEERNFTAN